MATKQKYKSTKKYYHVTTGDVEKQYHVELGVPLNTKLSDYFSKIGLSSLSDIVNQAEKQLKKT